MTRRKLEYYSGPSIEPVCACWKYRHYSGIRSYSVCYHYSLFPSVPSDFTGTIAGNRHCSTGVIEGPLPYRRSGGCFDGAPLYNGEMKPTRRSSFLRKLLKVAFVRKMCIFFLISSTPQCFMLHTKPKHQYSSKFVRLLATRKTFRGKPGSRKQQPYYSTNFVRLPAKKNRLAEKPDPRTRASRKTDPPPHTTPPSPTKNSKTSISVPGHH